MSLSFNIQKSIAYEITINSDQDCTKTVLLTIGNGIEKIMKTFFSTPKCVEDFIKSVTEKLPSFMQALCPYTTILLSVALAIAAAYNTITATVMYLKSLGKFEYTRKLLATDLKVNFRNILKVHDDIIQALQNGENIINIETKRQELIKILTETANLLQLINSKISQINFEAAKRKSSLSIGKIITGIIVIGAACYCPPTLCISTPILTKVSVICGIAVSACGVGDLVLKSYLQEPKVGDAKKLIDFYIKDGFDKVNLTQELNFLTSIDPEARNILIAEIRNNDNNIQDQLLTLSNFTK